MKLSWKHRLLLAGAALAATAAHAGLPLLTEDAGVLAARDCELEAGAFSERSDDGSALEQAVSLACGIGLDSQMGLAAGRVKEGDQSTEQRAVGGKISIWQGEEGAAAALAASAIWERADGHWRQATLNLNAVYSQPLSGDLILHLNLGHRENKPEGRGATTWAAALEHEGFALGGLKLAPMAEVFGNDRGAPWWNAGLRLTLLPDQLSLGASYGRQINPERARLATLSMKLAF